MIQSAYVHVPFCQTICSYCDFMRRMYDDTKARQWLEQIVKEIDCKIKGPLKTLYVGGGTPNALSIDLFYKLFEILSQYVAPETEFSVEINPELLSDEKIDILSRFKVNRISMGVQSFSDDLLKMMNRHHNESMVRDCIHRLYKAGIHDISIDLLYGLPDQSMESWHRDLQKAVSLPIQHISLYSLTIEENSVFGKKGICKADDDQEYEMYRWAIQFLQEQGFWQYEIANFARKGHESKHNQVYWHYEDFHGIGCGASGKESWGRYDNTRSFEQYLKSGPTPEKTALSKEEQMFECVMMGLRLRRGIDLEAFHQKYHVLLQEQFASALKKHLNKDLLIEDNHLKTTDEGKFVLHDILIDFL